MRPKTSQTISKYKICEAILAREKTGDSFPDRNAVEAMEEPLHRLTGAAVLHDQL
jgi:hypothetical protein